MSVSSSTTPAISSSQYISPDFFPSSALDAKNSPLALLVQTCSSIGKESQSNKSNINGNNSNNTNDKKDIALNLNTHSNNNNSNNSHNSSNHSSNNTNSYPKESSHRQKSNSPSDKACKNSANGGLNEDRKKSYNGVSNSSERKESSKHPSSNSKSSPNGKSAGFKVPASNNFGDRFMDKYTNGLYSEKYMGYNDDLAALAAANGRYFPGYSNTAPNSKNSNPLFPYMEGASQDFLNKNPFYPLYNSMKLQEAAALQNASNFPGINNLYPSLFGYPFPMDPLTAAAAAAAAYSANFVAAAAAAANQQKPASTNSHPSPRRCGSSLCKDPYCSGQHMPASSPSSILKNHSPGSHKNCTTPGCNQCPDKNPLPSSHPSADQLQAAANLFYPGGLPSSSFCLPPFNPLMLSSGLASSLLNQSINPPPSSPPQALTCNWVQGSEYCGKKIHKFRRVFVAPARTHRRFTGTSLIQTIFRPFQALQHSSLVSSPASFQPSCSSSSAFFSPQSLWPQPPKNFHNAILQISSSFTKLPSPSTLLQQLQPKRLPVFVTVPPVQNLFSSSLSSTH